MITSIAAIAAIVLAAAAATATPSPVETAPAAPTEARVVAAVFENLAVAFDPAQGCRPSDGECTVGKFLQKTLVFVAESERDAPKHAWQTASCEAMPMDEARDWAGEKTRYSPKLAARLAKSRAARVWACSLAFGHDDGGEGVWNREIRFWLADDAKHSVISDSFWFHYTP